MNQNRSRTLGIASRLKTERYLLIALMVGVIAFASEHAILEMGQTAALIAAAALIGTIVLASCASLIMPKCWPPRLAIPMAR
jgi:hypothetical protein